MSPHLSLSLRLTLWFSAIFLAGFLVFGGVMWFDLAWSLNAGRDKTLNGRANRAERALQEYGIAKSLKAGSEFEEIVNATPEGKLIQLYDLSGHRVYPQPSDAAIPFPWPAVPPVQVAYWGRSMYRGRHYRILSRRIEIHGTPLRIFVGGQLEDNRHNLADFSEGLLWGTPVLILASGAFGYFVSRRALRPIGRLIVSARSITIGNLSLRLPVSQPHDEIAQLAETCNEMLNRLEIAVGQITRFTADASHELRSPLAYIHGVGECALQTSDLSDDAAEALSEIVAEAKHASQLLNDLLLLARSDAGHADTAFYDLDLVSVLRDAVDRARGLADQKSQRLWFDAAGANCLIRGDETKLTRLFWILLENAVKYTPRGGAIWVTMEQAEDRVLVAVKDTGIGIPADALPRIFDRFFRVDAARSQEGTGLGLAIAKWISDVHMARITVESMEGAGSTFRVQFPALAVAHPQSVTMR